MSRRQFTRASMLALFRQTSAARCLSYLIVAVTLWIRWPVLGMGFCVDDFAQAAMVDGYYPVTRSPLNLFTFSDGSQHDNQSLRAVGTLPWWSHPDLRVSLLRPLSSALIWLDHQCFERDEYAYHLHSAIWWIAMMLAIGELIWVLVPGWAALIAITLFALHPAHNLLLGWIAGRNAIISTTFAAVGLRAQLSSGSHGRRSPGWRAILAWLLALSAGEYALGFLPYAAALNLERQKERRLSCVVAWLGALCGYVALRAWLGFGTRASGMYIDPVREPAAFLAAAAVRLPVLVGDVVLAARADWWLTGGFPWTTDLVQAGWLPAIRATDLTWLRVAQQFVGLGACVIATALVLRSFKPAESSLSHSIRALALGLPMAFVPALASWPESRLLLPALLGWACLLAREIVLAASLPLKQMGAAAVTLIFVTGLAGLHGALGTHHALTERHDLPAASEAIRRSLLSPEMDQLAKHGNILLLASAADFTTSVYLPLARRWYGRDAPSAAQLLTGGYGPLRLTRITDSTFDLERLHIMPTGLDEYAAAFNRLPVRVGDHFQSGELGVEVRTVEAGRLLKARYTLRQSLDSERIALVIQTRDGLKRLQFPGIGRDLLLPAAELPLHLLERQ